MDDRGAAAGIQHRPDGFAQRVSDQALLRGGARTHGGPRHGQAAHHDLDEVEVLDLGAFQEGDQHQPPVHAQAADVARHIGCADHVQDDVDAALAGEACDLLHKILGPVVDRRVGAQADAGGAFVVRAGGGIDRGAEFMGELDGGDSDPAGAAMDERFLAAGEASGLEQIRPDGEAGFGQRGGAQAVIASGPGQALRGGSGAVFRIAAAIGQGADLVADLPRRDIGTDRHDLARDFQAQDRAGAGRRRVGALALGDIGTVHTGGLDADQHLIGLRGWERALGEPHHLGSAGAVHLNEGHGLWQRHLGSSVHFSRLLPLRARQGKVVRRAAGPHRRLTAPALDQIGTLPYPRLTGGALGRMCPVPDGRTAAASGASQRWRKVRAPREYGAG